MTFDIAMSLTGQPNFRLCNRERSLPFVGSDSDRNFLKSLHAYIRQEKESLGCPEEGPDEQRYIIYSAVFDKVIDYATSYKTVLTAIKKEYDGFIRAVKTSVHDAKLAQGKLKAMVALPTALMYCQRRAVELRGRIAVIQSNTAKLQAGQKVQQESRGNSRSPLQQESTDDSALSPIQQIPGLTFEESVNPAALAKHLQHLEKRRADLLSKKKSQCVSVQVKADLENRMRDVLDQQEELTVENDRLQLRYKQLKLVNDAISSWEESEKEVPLLEFLASELQRISDLKVWDADSQGAFTAAFEEDDPFKINESKALLNYIERFNDLFEAEEYEAAAFHAAKSPHGVLRDNDTMERFKAVTMYEGELSPLLLFFQTLMISVLPGEPLPGETMSVEAVRCALRHNHVELVTHWVTQHRLSYSEALGDEISAYAGGEARAADICLALAYTVYLACGILNKAALSMCRRGLTNGMLQFMYQNKGFTADDIFFVLRGCPSLALLQALTQDYEGNPPPLSVGFACHALLNSDLENLALQLLEEIQGSGAGALVKTVLQDGVCGTEAWVEIARRCAQSDLPRLAQDITTTLLSQDGVVHLSPDLDGAALMDHVFM